MKKQNNASEEIFSQIGVGKNASVQRPQNVIDDRRLRKRIELAQANGDIIINVGRGYYRPDLNVPEEAEEFHHYINAKKSRIHAHLKTIKAMEKAAANLLNTDA